MAHAAAARFAHRFMAAGLHGCRRAGAHLHGAAQATGRKGCRGGDCGCVDGVSRVSPVSILAVVGAGAVLPMPSWPGMRTRTLHQRLSVPVAWMGRSRSGWLVQGETRPGKRQTRRPAAVLSCDMRDPLRRDPYDVILYAAARGNSARAGMYASMSLGDGRE